MLKFLIFSVTFVLCLAAAANTEAVNAQLETKLSFPVGTADLSAPATEKINESINSARKEGRIKEVKVVTWGDVDPTSRNVSHKELRASKSIAEKRANSIRHYLNDELKVENVSTYNMAHVPNKLEKFLKNSSTDFKSKLDAHETSEGLILIYLK